MSTAAVELREHLSIGLCTRAAPIFDPLSARIAEMRGWRICKLSGSVAKAAELALPDDVELVNPSDIVDISRRILRAADIVLIVDIDDAGGNASSVFRTVRELESVGVAAIEIQDAKTPQYFGETLRLHDLLYPVSVQVARLGAALAARRDDATCIVARTEGLTQLPTDDALARVAAYADAGVDAIMLPSLDPPRDGRADIEGVRSVTDLPILALGLTSEIEHDAEFLAANDVKLLYVRGFPAYRMAIKGIDDALAHLQGGGDPIDLIERMAPMEMLKRSPGSITQSDLYEQISERFDVVAEGVKRYAPDRSTGLPSTWSDR